MAGTITFKLKNPNTKKSGTKNTNLKEPGTKKTETNKQTPILMVFYYADTQLVVSTGERIAPKHWNQETHKARLTQEFSEGKNLNTRLETQEKDAMNTVRNHLNVNGTIIREKLKKELVDILRPKPVQEQEPMTFLKAIKEYIDNTNKAKRTKLSYGTTLKVLTDYQETYRKKFIRPLSFDSINMDFYEHFVGYLTIDKSAAVNTIGGHIKQIKVFMDYCNDKGYTTNQGHRHKKFVKVEEDSETIYLNDKELEIIYKKDLSKNKKLDRVRDLFMIGCYTGLRFSDLSQITPANIAKNRTQLRLTTQKTSEKVVIPLHWTIKEILEKYDNKLPRALSNQKFNEYLKKLGEEAKLNEAITIKQTKGGLTYDRHFKKYQLITVHTARRSFATNMFIAGVPTISIMKITGHRTERAFMKYIKITQEQNAELLANHKYFIKPLKIVKSPRKQRKAVS